MPTYEYTCEACGHDFEKFHSMSQPPIRKCPTCGKLKVQRKISTGGGIIFKGGGFYETDYRGDAYQKSKDADKAPDAKPAEGGETKPAEVKSGDAKPDAKPDVKAGEAAKPAADAPATPAPAKAESPKASKSAAKPKR